MISFPANDDNPCRVPHHLQTCGINEIIRFFIRHQESQLSVKKKKQTDKRRLKQVKPFSAQYLSKKNQKLCYNPQLSGH